jgi:CSLREA domain-containing protein
MRKLFPRLSLRSYRFVTVCIIFACLIGFGVSVSSHSGGTGEDSQRVNAPGMVQKGGTASLIASLFNAPMPLPSLTATMADSFPPTYDSDGDGKADVGDKIRYTVNIANSGTDATNVTLQDTIDPHTSLFGTMNISPVAVNDTYDTVANTLLEVGVAASGNPAVRVTDPSKNSAFDNDKEFLGDTFSFDTITVNPTKGTLTFNTDGTFSYQPTANQTGTDTFTYRIKDAQGLTDTAVVTININAAKVWYVKNNVSGAGTGTSSDPFKALSSAAGASAAGDTIYVMNGDGTTAQQNTGFAMKANQRLIGEATQLDVPVALNGGASPTVLKTATANYPKISGTTEGVSVLNVTGALITGLNISATNAGSNAIDATTNAGNSGGVEVANCVISGALAEGIDVNGGGTGTMTVSIHNNTVTATGNGIDIARTAGSVIVTAFNDNSISGTTGGTGINVVGTGAAVLFDATAGGAYNTVSFGTTVIGAAGAGNGTGAAGLVLNNVAGDITFTDLDVFTDNGTALLVVGTNANFNAGTATGTRVTANTGTPTLTAVGGAALDTTSTNINLGSNTVVTSTNSASTGVSLTQTSGTFNGASGSSITNATGVDFSVNGGSNANANVGISFAGTITDDVGMLVQIQNVTASSTHAFTALITDNFDGDGTEQGISLTGNTGANITFSGGINIRTTTNAAFTSTGAGGTGTLTITDPSGATANKLQTTTGTALNVANTNIGAGGLVFESISANGGSNGIILSSTGASGGLTVTGTGGTCTDADKTGCSGGVIQNLTGSDDSGATPVGTGIVLNNTRNVSLTRMYVHDASNYGINGTSVVGFTMANSVVSGSNGTNVNSPFRDSSMSFGELTGTVNISNSFISGGILRNLEISNTSGSLDITVNACNIHDTGKSPYTGGLEGDDNFFLENQSTANIAAHITNNTFSQASGDHFNGNLTGSGTVSYVITGNNYSNTLTGGRTTLLGGGFFILGASYNGNFTYKVSDNGSIATPLTGNNQGGAIVVNKGSGSSTYSGRIENNVIGNPAVTGSGSKSASGIDVESHGSGSHTTLINNNTIRQYHDGGIVLISGESPSGVGFDATITNNTISNPDNISGALGNAIHINTGTVSSPADIVTACMDIKSNSIAAGGEDGDNGTLNDSQVDLRVRQRFSSTTRLPGLPAGQGSDAGPFLTGQNTLTTVTAVPTSGTFTGGAACATAANISMNFGPNQQQREYFAQTANPFLQTPSSSLFSVLTDIASTASDADLNRFLSESNINDNSVSRVEDSSATSKLFAPLFAIQPEGETASTAPAIKSEAFALAHGNNNSTLGGRLSSLVSAFAETVSPTANAAPAPMPLLEINQNIGTLPAGESITVIFDVTVNAPPVAQYSNQMVVKADGIADVLTDDQPGTAAPNEPTITPGDVSDLQITNSDSPDPVSSGANITYTINFKNNGPSAADSVAFSDVMDANTTLVSVNTPAGWSRTDSVAVGGTGTLTFTKGTAANQETATFTVVAKVTSSVASGVHILNKASATSAKPDPDSSNNTDITADTTTQTRADLAVTNADSPDPVIAGGNITYTVNFVNNGPSDAQTVTLTNAVPANTTLVSAATGTAGWSRTDSVPAGGTGNVVFSKASVAAGDTASFTIVVQVGAGVADATIITDNATAASATTDPTPGNDTGTATTSVVSQADLQVSKTGSPDPDVYTGANITYTINFKNNGPNTAQSVTLSDAVPTNTKFVSAVTPSGWSRTDLVPAGGTGTITFTKSSAADQETATFTVVVKVDAGAPGGSTITNNATASSSTTDPTPGNNTGTATTNVVACTASPVVINTSDSGAGSLRQAIIDVCPGGTIDFNITGAGPHTITLSTGELTVDKDLTIQNTSGESVTVSGGGASRVFQVDSGKTVSISNLTVSGGNASDAAGGAGIRNQGTLTVNNSTVSGNSSANGLGGGIFNMGSLTVTNSTVSGNTSGVGGGGISTFTGTTLVITNSTISGNSSDVDGGGIVIQSPSTVTITNATITNNFADSDNNASGTGGGINVLGGTVTLSNTIVAGNFNEDGATDAADDIAGTLDAASSFNLIGAGGAGGLTNGTNNNQVGVANAGLSPLANNGGPTFTHALLVGSPAIDAGNSVTADQRGQTRPVDNPNVTNVANGSDIGAYEAPAPPTAPDLKDASDLGTSNSDNVTSDTSPTFTITGVSNGEVVTLYRDGVSVASNTAAGSSIDLTDPSVTDGTYNYTATRTVNGGISPASAGLSVTIETVAPTINISAPSQASANAGTASVSYTITYGNADSITLANGDVTLNTTGTASATVGVSGSGNTTRTVTLTGITGNGTIGISIAAGTATDTAGNTAPAAGPSSTFVVDTVVPTVSSIVRADANPTSAASVNFTVTFSENVTGVDNADFAVTASGITGASVTGVTGSNNVYTVTVNTGSGDGTLRLDVADDDTIVDQASNPLGGAGAGNGNFTAGETYTVDKTDPSVSSIVRASANPTNAASVNFTVTFSEGVTGVDTGDFSLTTTGSVAGASVSTVTPVDSSHYTVAVNTGAGDGTIRLDVADNDSIVDQASKPIGGVGAGNGNFTTGEVYTVDKTAPSINIGSPSASASNGTGNVTFTVTYADANFNTSTLSTGNITLNTTGTATATIGVDAGSGTTRTVTLSGITGNGTIGISIAAGTATDTAGNTAPAAGPSSTFVVDTVVPTVSSIVRADANPTFATTVNFTVTFSENVTGVDATDFALTNTGVTGASVTGVTGSNNVYTVTVNTGSGDGTLRLDVADDDTIVDQASNPLGGAGAGNGNFTAGETYTVDKNAPTVNITAVTPDPRNTSVSSITIVFSEAVTGFDLNDLSLKRDGGANLLTGAQTLTSGDNITWTLGNLSGVTGTGGTYTLTLTASGSGITDNASNALAGDATETWVMDTTAPTVTINQAAGQTDPVTNATEINFTVVFTEPVTGFDAADVDLSTSTAGGTLVATVTEIAPNDGTTYNVKVTGMNASGSVVATVNANAAKDAADNDSAASTSTDNSVTYQQDNLTTFLVNTLANTDDGSCDALGTGSGNQDCSLREAINAANADFGAETISFAPALTSGGPATITLDGLGALADITDDVTITGPTNNRLTINGNNTVRVFTIASGNTVDISSLTIANGRASGVGTSIGGGIYNQGTLTITNSTFTGNKAAGAAGMGGAIDNFNGSLTIINSTISGNSADADGGGILNDGSGTATIVNVTITGNRSDADDLSPGDGGGIAQKSTNAITLINTIVAGNLKGTASPVADDIFVLGGSTIDTSASKNNLIGDAATSGGLTNGTNGNIVGNAGAGTININTVLQTTLAGNGGPTQTHLLVPGSPAINAGNNCVTLASGSGGCLTTAPLTTDQRGTGFPRIVNTTADIGAVEVNYAISATAGTPQSTVINTAFATLMKATVTESGIPQNNLSVTFTAPGAGASGTFASSSTVQTDVNGVATAPAFTANNVAGSYNVVANLGGFPPSANFALTNTKATQTITFGALSGKTFGDAPFTVSATGGPSGNPVTFSSLTPLVCSVSGNTVTILAAGGCTIRASQAGDTNYDPAPNVDQSFTVAKASSTTTVTVSNATFDGNPHGGTATVTGAGGLNQSVTITYTGRNSTVYGPSTTAPTNTGDYTASAIFAGDANHNGSNDSKDFQITKANQTITFNPNPLPNKTYGDADFGITATASSGLTVSFAASGQCTVASGTVHLTGAGGCTITASQAGNSNYNAASDVIRSFSIATAATTVSLSSSANPSITGSNVTFTATVNSTAGTPTGTVQFKVDNVNVGSPVALNGSGVATFTTNTLTVGNHTIAADYSGSANFAASTGTLGGGQVVIILPSISITDVTVTEGNSGTTNATFTISLSQASNQTVSVDFATANGTATAGSDYQSTSGTLTFIPGETQKTISVAVNGDTLNEPNETFFVNLTNQQNSTIADNQGQGTILNDDQPGVQFTRSDYTVPEANASGFVSITVTRTGDTSQPLSVDFMTSDQSGTTPCQTNNNGFASDRCDYATAAGTLRFGAGESAKSIPVIIINDAYVEPTEQFTIKLSNVVGATINAPDTATVFITDNDTQVATTNPIDGLDYFIYLQYIDFLGRVPDADGFQFWKNRMTTNCPVGETCDRADTSFKFFSSDEFKLRGYFVYLFYHASLGRRPTYSEWILDVSKLNGFQTLAEQQANKDAFVNEFISRTEFMNLYNGFQTGQTLVDALIQKSGVTPAARQSLIDNYGTVGRAKTVQAFMETPEVQAAFFDRAFVTMLYFGYLRRDAEPGGFGFWMQKLNDSGHNYKLLIGGFIDSDEYRFRYAEIPKH